MGYGGLPRQVRSFEVIELQLSEISMARRLLKESLIILGGTLFFLGLCATVGISTSTPPTSPAAEAARAEEHSTEDQELDRSSVREIEEATTTPPSH